MRLKTLTLQGFKSFAGRVRMELPDGIAAVVGPNGSGKSNISDAIRWVMGEQSIRLLRGTRLEDVIFAGSEGKKQVGLAEVSLTFDNESGRIPLNYSEVTVTRRVFRSGESDFLINKKACRLRDIQELFMDTGLGRGGLSIIGQGEIGAVLSAKPEDRRALIDEAAGITKYRVRKRETIVRLDRTKDDLDRVADIISEVESRLGPLEKQAEAAALAKSLTDRLDVAQLHLLNYEFKMIKTADADAKNRLAHVADEYSKAERIVGDVENTVDQLTGERESLDKQLETSRSKEDEANKALLSCRHEIEMTEDRALRGDAEASERLKRLDELKNKRSVLSVERASVAKDMSEATTNVQETKAKLAAVEKERTQARMTDDEKLRRTEQLRARIVELAADAASKKSRIESLHSRREERERATEALKQRQQSLKSEKRVLVDKKNELATSLQEVLHEIEHLKNEKEPVIGHIDRLVNERPKIEKQLNTTKSKLNEAAARRRALSDLEKAGEGYFRGVREVLAEAQKRRSTGLLGAVAQLIRVDTRFERAIEVALGAASQFVVANTDADAKSAIEFLKKRRLGRVTFLPLNVLSPRSLDENVKNRLLGFEGVLGVASDLVDVAPETEKAIVYLLGRVVITETIDGAISLTKQIHNISRAVSLDGDVVVPGGAMTGGGRPTQGRESLLSRPRQIDELAEVIKKLTIEVDRLQLSINGIDSELKRKRDELVRIEASERELVWKRSEIERNAKAQQEAEVKIVQLIHASAEEVAAAMDEKQADVDEADKLKDELSSTDEERREAISSLEQLEAMIEKQRETDSRLQNESEQLKVELARKEQFVSEWKRNLERLDLELTDTSERIAQEKEDLRSIEQSRLSGEEQLKSAKDRVVELEKRVREIQHAKVELTSRRQNVQLLLSETTDKLKRAREAREIAQDNVTRRRIEAERAAVRLEQLLETFDERGVRPDEATDRTLMTEGEAKQMRREVSGLKKELDAIGPVNMHSIEEFAEVTERYKFLTIQRDDLNEAIDRLEQVIAKIDEKSKAKLVSVFAELRSAFQKTFVRLFRGGRADLSFTDPDEPLQSGIDMFVQPPGKKMQNLMALSGGEKALSAVALLFALLDVTSIPFCLLDEVDAALDERNLDRFQSLLLEYAKKTQFLIITHRQATMEGMERLFGVTMEDAGVSTLVPLNLEEVG